MMKVMLIGDSIRMNYQERVREIVGDRAVVHGPAENCRFAAYTLFQLHGWVPDDDYDVIHWNHGQWDTCYLQYISADKVHLSPAGVELCAGLVSAALLGQK